MAQRLQRSAAAQRDRQPGAGLDDSRRLFGPAPSDLIRVTITTSPEVPELVSYEVGDRVYGRSRYNNAIAVDPLDPHTCYVAGTRPARVSDVDFTTGSASGFELGKQGSLQDGDHPHVDHHGLLTVATTSDGTTSTSLYDVTDGGAWMLPDAATAVAIAAMGYHPKNSGILYVAENNTEICRTTDGKNFDYIYQSNIPELPISAIAVDATDPTGDHPWVAQSAFHTPGTDEMGAIFQTVDGGQRWTDFSGGLPNLPVWSLLQCSSVKPSLLFAGTDDGVYSVVLDGKSSWTRFGSGLPTVRVRSLQLAHRAQSGALYLIAGTYRRGITRFPSVAPPPADPRPARPLRWNVPTSSRSRGRRRASDRAARGGRHGGETGHKHLDAMGTGAMAPGQPSVASSLLLTACRVVMHG